MSSIARPPDPCLVAIILIVRSRAGPRLVFHYPPNPLSENGFRPSLKGRRISRTRSGGIIRGNDSDISDASGPTSDEDEEENHVGAGSGGIVGTTPRRTSNFGVAADDSSAPTGSGAESQRSARFLHKKRGGVSDVEEESGVRASGTRKEEVEEEDDDVGSRSPGESILGLQMDVWEKLLSPSRAWHKRRFEVGINDLAFVGWPVFVREDGTWRKQKRKKEKKGPWDWEGRELGHNEMEDGRDEAAEVNAEANGAAASHDMGRDSEDKDCMTMFNVVFVLDPPLLEYSVRVREIYDNIIKKFAKALKWEQARTDYVWRESQHILHLKEMAKEKSMRALSLPYLMSSTLLMNTRDLC